MNVTEKFIGICKNENVCQTRNTEGMIDVKEQIW